MNETIDKGNSRKIESVEKCCKILDCLHEFQSLTLTELADCVDLTPGTIYPHLTTLQENKLVYKEGDEYSPSFKFLRIGATRRRNNKLYPQAFTKMEELANRIDARVQLYVEEFGMGICVEHMGSKSSIQPPDKVGDEVPLHVIAAGKAILAELPDEKVEEIFRQRGLPKYTEKTIRSEEELFDALDEVSKQGYAINDEEYIKGLGAVGAAITTEDGDVIGSISASVPTNRMGGPEFKETIPHEVINITNTIELDIRVG